MDNDSDIGSVTRPRQKLTRVIFTESFTVPAEIAETDRCPLKMGDYFAGTSMECLMSVADWLASYKYARIAGASE